MRARLLFALLLIGCGSNPSTEPSDPTESPAAPPTLACAEAPCALFEHLDRFEIEGLASHVAGLELPAVTEDWRQDFTGEPGGRFQGQGGRIEGKGDGRHLALRSRGKVPVWVSPPIPTAADREYTLRWRSALDRVASPPRDPAEFAGLTVRFYRVEGDETTALDQDASAKKLRVQAHRSAEWRPAEGRAPWHEETRTFRRPRSATHMVVRVAGGPAMAGGKASVQVDDIVLESRLAPAWTARKNDVWSEPDRHPLLRKARGVNGSLKKARDIREVVLAPAPSTLKADVVVPDGGTLALGFGLTPGRGKAKVKFEAAVVADGKRTVVLQETASGAYRPAWKDRVVDLSPWAGQTVTIELVTKGKKAPDDVLVGLSRQPHGRAVWTTGQLEGSGVGRLAILLIVDTLGASHSSGWGGTREQTPQLQRIAAAGTHYARGLAPSPWTLPSIATYLTGLTPDTHGAGQKLGNDHWDRRPVLPAFDTLAEKLRAAGWDTRGWVNNPFLAPRNSALDQGFVSYMDYNTRSEEHAAAPAVKQVLAELARPGNGDRFILLHMLDPHGPYQPDADHQARFVDPAYDGPVTAGNSKGGFRDILNRRVNPSPADKQMLVDLHDGVVAYADAQVGAVFDAAQASGRELLFVVTSDHGEEFWEHGRFEHGHSVYDELLHVPLLSWRTGGAPGRVEGAVDARGVFGTVLDFAGVDHPGTPSLPEAGEAAVFASPTLYGHRQRAAEQGGWKYILKQPETGENHRRVGTSPRQSLFELSTDPTEATNRLSAAPKQAARLHEALVEEALQGFPGAWFVVASGEPSDLTLRQVGGRGWHPDVHDFPWPRTDGQSLDKTALSVKRVQGSKASGVRLKIGHGPTLLILEPRDDDGRVEAVLGEGVADVRHTGQLQGQKITFEADPVRTTPSEVLAALRGDTPRLMIGRLAGDLRPRGREDAPSGSDVAALRALGYME
jgi:arylsulfatase A-like enzyme